MALSDDWSYQLGQAFLTAATSCGFECERTFVADSCSPESPPPGCPCQLVAVVSEGWERDRPCGARRVAEVRLVLDLCTVDPGGPDSVPDPVAVNTSAQAQAAARWAIMRGLRQAQLDGLLTSCVDEGAPLSSCCARIWPGVWRCVASGGGSVRWETVWRYDEDT